MRIPLTDRNGRVCARIPVWMVVTATISHAVMIDIIYYLHSGKIGNSNASGMLLIYYFIAFSFFAIIMSAIASAYLLSRYDRKISKE